MEITVLFPRELLCIRHYTGYVHSESYSTLTMIPRSTHYCPISQIRKLIKGTAGLILLSMLSG